jgi:hypothetical protein
MKRLQNSVFERFRRIVLFLSAFFKILRSFFAIPRVEKIVWVLYGFSEKIVNKYGFCVKKMGLRGCL